jgi:hypothetical protein
MPDPWTGALARFDGRALAGAVANAFDGEWDYANDVSTRAHVRGTNPYEVVVLAKPEGSDDVRRFIVRIEEVPW